MPPPSSTLFASQNVFAALDTKKTKKKKSSKEKDDKGKKDKSKHSEPHGGAAAATVAGSSAQAFNSSAPLNWADDDDEDDDFGVPVAAWMQVLSVLRAVSCFTAAELGAFSTCGKQGFRLTTGLLARSVAHRRPTFVGPRSPGLLVSYS